jgi:hypothetical protein
LAASKAPLMMNASAAAVRLLHGDAVVHSVTASAGFALPSIVCSRFLLVVVSSCFPGEELCCPAFGRSQAPIAQSALKPAVKRPTCTGSRHSGFMRCARVLGNASRMSTSTHVSDLTPYRNRDGNSGVSAYQLLDDGIIVRFVEDGTYRYGSERPGRYHVGQMKSLAMAGRGLAKYINRYVRDKYEERLD